MKKVVSNKQTCQENLKLNALRIEVLRTRFSTCNLHPKNYIIYILSVDDVNGAKISQELTPGKDWQKAKEEGKLPFDCGILHVTDMVEALTLFNKTAAEKLIRLEGIRVVVVDHSTAELFII